MQEGCFYKKSRGKLGLPIDVNVSEGILQAHKRSWELFFEKYSMETGNVKELNLETLKSAVDENEEICQQRLPMRNTISSVQYWVNTGKPPCLSVVDKNYNSPEETSLSEEEISALHPTAISPLEHNSPHPPQPAIIPSEPTKLCSSIVSSDSVNTRQYILSSNLAKKNMSLTIVENEKLHDLSLNRNNLIDEADVYVDVCGTDEFPKITTEDKEQREKTINSQSTVVFGCNNHILPNSQASTILRVVPTGSLKIEDVIPSLRNIRDSPEIYESDTSTSEKSNELILEHKNIVVESIIEKNNRRKLFTNPRSPVEWPQYSSPKRIIARKSSSLSTNSTLHPALDISDPKRSNTWRKKLFYKRKLVTINETNEKPLKVENVAEPIVNGEKLKKCSVILQPLILESLEKKRKSEAEKNELELKKIKISPQTKITETNLNLVPLPTNGEEEKSVIEEKEKKKISINTRKTLRASLRNKTVTLPIKKKIGKVVKKKKKINLKKLTKRKGNLKKVEISKVSEIKTHFSAESDSDEKWTNNTKQHGQNANKRLTTIFTFDSDEEFDMTTIFHTNIKNSTKTNKTEKVKQSSENQSLFTELSLYTSEEKENQRKTTINNQFQGTNPRRWTKLVILPSSEDEIPQEEKILPKERKRKKVKRKKKNQQEYSKNQKNTSEGEKLNEIKNNNNNSFNQSPKKRKMKKKESEEKEESSNLDISKNSDLTNLKKLEKNSDSGENGIEGKNEESEFEDIFEIRPKGKENSKQGTTNENSKLTQRKENSKRRINMNVRGKKNRKINSNNTEEEKEKEENEEKNEGDGEEKEEEGEGDGEEKEEVMGKIEPTSKKNAKNKFSTPSSDEEEKEKTSPSRNRRKVKKNLKPEKNEKSRKLNNSHDQLNSSGYETKFDENIPNEIKMKSSIANSSPKTIRSSPRKQEKTPEELTKEKNEKNNYFKFSSSDDDEDIFNLDRKKNYRPSRENNSEKKILSNSRQTNEEKSNKNLDSDDDDNDIFNLRPKKNNEKKILSNTKPTKIVNKFNDSESNSSSDSEDIFNFRH